MPHIFEAEFKIRFDECDPFGRLSNANALRLAIQAAMNVSETVGNDLLTGDTRWQLREVGIEYKRPVNYGNTIQIQTYVSDWRDKELSLEQDLLVAGEPVAKVHTDWEILSLETFEPVSILSSVVRALFSGPVPPEASPRSDFPELPDEPPGAFSARRNVRWSQLNPNGWLDYGHYITLLEEINMDVAAYLGWPPRKYEEQGVALSARSHHIEFNTHATFDDELKITTYLSNVVDTRMTRHYLIEEPVNGVIARAQTIWMCIEPVTGQETDIPPDWFEAFNDQISE